MSNVKIQMSKMIKIFLFTGILLALSSLTTLAQTKTSTLSPTLVNPTMSTEDKEIQTLKEKIATKVAELREKNSKAVSGTVQELISPDKLSMIKIKTWKGEDFEVKIDPDLTKFYQISGEQKKEVKSNALKKDSYIIITGIIKDKNIDANFVYLDELFIVGSGKVTEVNKQDFFLNVITIDKENFTLDVETTTKQFMFNIKTLNIENVGFTKIKEGDTIHFVLKKTGIEKQVNRFAAQKILIIPQEYFIK